MAISPLAGKPAPKELLVDVARLEREYFERQPDLGDPQQLVSFGTSGHRGSSLARHVHRGPHPGHHAGDLRLPARRRASTARSTWARTRTRCPAPAQRTALEVLAANGVETVIQRDDGVTPTPVISRAILVHNRGRDGAPRRRHRHHAVAQSAGGRRLQVQPAERRPGRHRRDAMDPGSRQRSCCASGNAGVKRVPFAAAMKAATTHAGRLRPALRRRPAQRHRHGGDPRAPASSSASIRSGGAAVHYWEPITDVYGLDIAVVNPEVDPTFSFMTVDHDGKIRMDCSSPYAMARLVGLKDRYRVAFANDPDADRHGIVTPSVGLMNPEPLPRRRHPLPADAPPALARPTPPSARRWSAAA